MRTEQKVIENIILINPLICGIQQEIEREQDALIADIASPAIKIVQRLFELDNKRIDLCNLNVLYGFIERGLGDKFGLLCLCVYGGTPSELFSAAARQIELAGYSIERVNNEFDYLFKRFVKEKTRRKIRCFAQTKVEPAYGV